MGQFVKFQKTEISGQDVIEETRGEDGEYIPFRFGKYFF